MFQGSHAYHVDDKGRLKMPADFVHGLGGSFTVTRGKNRCLWIFPEVEWKRMVEQLRGDMLADSNKLHLQRFFIGSAASLSLDAQNRMTIPPVLREFAGIEHEVMLVGLDDRIELWSRQRWQEYEALLSEAALEEWARSAGY